jgi:hypothetical protein
MKAFRAAGPVAVALLGSLWLVGCDTPANQADRKVQEDVAKAQLALQRGDASGVEEAQKLLETAASSTDISSLTKAYAKSSLALVEQNNASKIMRQIDDNDQTLRQLIYEIGRLAQQVDTSRAMAAVYDKYDPKPAHDAITAAIAAAQGGPDQAVWVKQDNSSIPSLTAVKQTISQLQGQIAKQNDALKVLQDQRTQTLDEADQADKSSEISKDQQSVDDFKRGADLKKQAGDLAVQIAKNQAQTVPMQNDLAVAQGQQVVLEKLIQELQDESVQLDTGWKSVQDAVSSQAVLQKQIVAGNGEAAASAAPAPAPAETAAAGGGAATGTPAVGILSPTAGKSLNDKAEALGKLVDEIKQERTDALSDLNNAIHHYSEAAVAGQDFYASLDTKIKDPANMNRPEMDAWKNLQAIGGPANYHIKEALAQRQLAELYVSAVDNDNRRAKLQDEVSKILGTVNIPVPPGLSDAGLDDDKKTATTDATTAYTAAEEGINNLTTGLSPEPLKNIAKVEAILTFYGEVQLARATGDSATAAAKLASAEGARDEAVQDGLQIPPLPPEIAASAAPKPAAPPA